MQGSFIENELKTYERYKETALSHRRFKHHDIVPLLENLSGHHHVNIAEEGRSAEGRSVYRVTIGSGKVPVLMWSQMHGDEPTATMALFDLLNRLTAGKDETETDPSIDEILRNVTLHLIPMLNPDAVQRFQRLTPYGVDMNRDALARQCPESRLLKRVRDDTGAEFGFNLHDQNTRYTPGDAPESTLIAFLSPPYDANKSIDSVRGNSMKIITGLHEMLRPIIPGRVASFSDEFEPRAFGDNMQKWGTSTILIESGGMRGDREKQFIRKLNYLSLLESLRLIATGAYERYSCKEYDAIPPNKLRLFDVLFRNAVLDFNDCQISMDIGINRIEKNNGDCSGFYIKGEVAEVGDLSTCNGYEEYDASGLKVMPGKLYTEAVDTVENLSLSRIKGLIRDGYTTLKVNQLPREPFSDFPVNFAGSQWQEPVYIIPETDANLVFCRNDNQEPLYVVINGFVMDLRQDSKMPENTLVYP